MQESVLQFGKRELIFKGDESEIAMVRDGIQEIMAQPDGKKHIENAIESIHGYPALHIRFPIKENETVEKDVYAGPGNVLLLNPKLKNNPEKLTLAILDGLIQKHERREIDARLRQEGVIAEYGLERDEYRRIETILKGVKSCETGRNAVSEFFTDNQVFIGFSEEDKYRGYYREDKDHIVLGKGYDLENQQSTLVHEAIHLSQDREDISSDNVYADQDRFLIDKLRELEPRLKQTLFVIEKRQKNRSFKENFPGDVDFYLKERQKAEKNIKKKNPYLSDEDLKKQADQMARDRFVQSIWESGNKLNKIDRIVCKLPFLREKMLFKIQNKGWNEAYNKQALNAVKGKTNKTKYHLKPADEIYTAYVKRLGVSMSPDYFKDPERAKMPKEVARKIETIFTDPKSGSKTIEISEKTKDGIVPLERINYAANGEKTDHVFLGQDNEIIPLTKGVRVETASLKKTLIETLKQNRLPQNTVSKEEKQTKQKTTLEPNLSSTIIKTFTCQGR